MTGTKMIDVWTPIYSRWRHGGWYVHNVRYPNGAIGCVSRNYPDKKWRVVCGDHSKTYPTRDAAALAEREMALLETVNATADRLGNPS